MSERDELVRIAEAHRYGLVWSENESGDDAGQGAYPSGAEIRRLARGVLELSKEVDRLNVEVCMWQRHAMPVASIEQQRELGWPDIHPEDYCHRCGHINPLWVTDRESWLAATAKWSAETGREGICCPACFIAMHADATGVEAIWTLAIWTAKDSP